jgi:hypothetical protein
MNLIVDVFTVYLKQVVAAWINVVVSALELYFRPTLNGLQDEQRSQRTVRPQEY